MSDHPKIVTQAEWQAAHEEFLVLEKQAMRARDQLNAQRRRLPMVKIEKDYSFESPTQQISLLNLFEGRKQLIIYHFMYHKEDDTFCHGCSFCVDQIGHLAHLHARDTSFALIARAPVNSIDRHKKRLGWDIPWYSSYNSDFNTDFGMSTSEGETFGLSVFLREGKDVYRTYFTNSRGVETLGTTWSLLDVTPYGRQEEWEDSPKGWPQTPPYQWWRLHDEYPDNSKAKSCKSCC